MRTMQQENRNNIHEQDSRNTLHKRKEKESSMQQLPKNEYT